MARNWKALVEQANDISSLLRRKPQRHKIGYQCSPSGILNAYREGDLTFKQAVRELERWKARNT